MNTVKLPYTCKFCQKPGFVDYEHNGMLTEDQVNNWLKYVACDSCAEFHRRSRDLTRNLLTLAGNWANVIKYSPKSAGDIREETRLAVERVLRRLCAVIEKKTHWGGLFQTELIGVAMQSPNHAMRVIKSLFNHPAADCGLCAGLE